MKLIENLSDMIAEELDGAKHYIKCSLKHKDEHRSLAETLYNISLDEMRHMNLLHSEVVKLIEQYRREKGDPPADMLAVYDYLHNKEIEKAGEIKAMQTMYKDT